MVVDEVRALCITETRAYIYLCSKTLLLQQTRPLHLLQHHKSSMTSPSPAYLIDTATYGLFTPPVPDLPINAAKDMPTNDVGDDEAPPETTPSNYIPGLFTLGSTYDVLNGKYADSKSAIQQVIDWNKSKAAILFYLYRCSPLICRRRTYSGFWRQAIQHPRGCELQHQHNLRLQLFLRQNHI